MPRRHHEARGIDDHAGAVARVGNGDDASDASVVAVEEEAAGAGDRDDAHGRAVERPELEAILDAFGANGSGRHREGESEQREEGSKQAHDRPQRMRSERKKR